MLELTCSDVDMEVFRVGDVAVLRAVTDVLTIDLPLASAGVEEVIKALRAAFPVAA